MVSSGLSRRCARDVCLQEVVGMNSVLSLAGEQSPSGLQLVVSSLRLTWVSPRVWEEQAWISSCFPAASSPPCRCLPWTRLARALPGPPGACGVDSSALGSHSVFSDLTLNNLCSVSQDSGIPGRKRKASTSLTDDEGLSPWRFGCVQGSLKAPLESLLGAQGVEYRLDWKSPVAQQLMLLGAGGLGGGRGFAVKRRGVGLWRREGVRPCACVRVCTCAFCRSGGEAVRVGGRSQREGRPAVVRAQLRWRGGPRVVGLCHGCWWTLSHQEPAVGLLG